MIFALLCIATAALQAYNMAHLSRGRIPYASMIVTYLGYTGIELWLALRDSFQLPLVVFTALNVWALTASVQGWRRQRK